MEAKFTLCDFKDLEKEEVDKVGKIQQDEYGTSVRKLILEEIKSRNICLITEGSLLDISYKENKGYAKINLNNILINYKFDLIKLYGNLWVLRKSYREKDVVLPCISPEGMMQTGQNWFDILINIFPEIRTVKQSYQIVIEKKLQEMFFSGGNRLIKYNSPIRISDLEKSNIDILYELFLYSVVGDSLMYLKRVFPDFLNINNCRMVIDNKISTTESLLLFISENNKKLLLGRESAPDAKFKSMKLVPSKGIFLQDALGIQFMEKNKLVLSDAVKKIPIEILNRTATTDDRVIRGIEKLFELELINKSDGKKMVQKLVRYPKSYSEIQIALRNATTLPLLNYVENSKEFKSDSLGDLVSGAKTILDNFREKMIKDRKTEMKFSEVPYEVQLATSIQIVLENLSLKYFYNKPDLMNYTQDQIWVNYSVVEQKDKKYATIGLLRPNLRGELEGSFAMKFELRNR